MAGRRTFFSFHYKRDIWRACVVRNANVVDAEAAAGWRDASLWEETKRKGDAAIRALIDQGLMGTTVTVVLIGAETSKRTWVNYEIRKSIERGNGLLGVRIHTIAVPGQGTDYLGPVPQLLVDNNVPIYAWDPKQLGTWVEKAAVTAGHRCLQHNLRNCFSCG